MVAHLFGVVDQAKGAYVAFEHIEQVVQKPMMLQNRQACFEAVVGRYNHPGLMIVHLGSGDVGSVRELTDTVVGSYPGIPVRGRWRN